MRKAVVIGGALVIVIAAGVAAYLLLRGSSGPSESERASCAAIQDYLDDIQVGPEHGLGFLPADVRRAQQAANRGTNDTLAKLIGDLRVALDDYLANIGNGGARSDLLGNALHRVERECTALGIHLRET